MTQEYIRQLAVKFLNGTASEEEKEILHKWYDSLNPDVSETETVFTRDPDTANEMKERMLANMKALQQPVRKTPDFTLIKRLVSWSTAVAALVIAGFIFWTNQHKTAETGIRLVQAPLGKTLKVTLPDGSFIWLNAGSSLTYPHSFSGKTREVVLKEGQAFFDVKHMTDKPFIVHAKTLNITVLGTSFDVKAYHNDPDIKVTVKTGKVGVTMRDNPERPALMLLPAEQAVVPEKSAEIHVTEISKPAIAPWKDNRMVFEDELLSEVFRVLERKYRQQIKIEKPELTTEKITLTLDDQPIGDVLKVLGFSKKFNYSQLNDSTIVIK
ncbi:FecR domain-containing protein [Dyadobacter sp. LJ53]|uniref:FecR family protein n=1 Tax=Dyadobacter chenwenxiniae TaxID=2906456 RepID=UPI001F1FAA91|nr:FecR family protein [Dyadobacter chenwenxiniae]MCF0050344.1 FecR domain-containing protein [Dyadobacter chenwenxiniae]